MMYSASEDEEKKYPYLGLAMHGVPHVSTFSREQIKMDDSPRAEHPMIAERVRINGAAAGILDLFAIEEMLQQAAI